MYRSYYQPRFAKRKTQTRLASVVDADTMWAAAAVADRINNGAYIKADAYKLNEHGVPTNEIQQFANRVLIKQVLGNLIPITDEDRALGRAAREWHQKTLLIKTLKGKINDFEKAVSQAVEKEDFWNTQDQLAISVVASQIRSYRQGMKMDEIMEDVVRTPVADVGEKVQLRAQVIRCVYSQNYNVHFITAKTDENQMVFFSYREGLDAMTWITLRGTVKAHRPDATQLNRVKLV
jgi:hypothetical protein